MTENTQIKRKLTKADMDDYKNTLSAASDENKGELIFNGSLLHALAVYTQMVKKAIADKVPSINFYCGKATLLRINAVEDIITACNGLFCDDISKDVIKGWHEEFEGKLQEFIERGGQVNVIIDRRLRSDINKNPIMPFLLSNRAHFTYRMLCYDFSLPHFAFFGKTYRLETSDLQKSALCCFCGDDDHLKMMNDTFNRLTAMSDDLR